LDFNHQTHAEFFKRLSDHARAFDPPRYTWTNYIEGPERELSDLRSIDVLYSENTLNAPPLHWNLYDYKRLLALQEGGPVGISYYSFPTWLKLDPTNQYRVLAWQMQPEFVALGIAEGMAADGGHILHPGMYLYHPEGRWRELVRGYTQFHVRNQELYRLAQMAGNVALVLPAASAGRGAPAQDDLARRLAKLGVAFEVILETDLQAETLAGRGFDTMIVPHAHCLNAERVDELAKFARGGGTVVVSQHFAQRDELGFPHRERVAARLLGEAAGTRFVYNMPLDARLEGFVPGGRSRIDIPVGEEGTAKLNWQGPAGRYDIGLRYFDEWDGISTLALSVNDAELDRWKLDGEDGITWHHVRGFDLHTGDVITVYAKANMGERARIYSLEVVPTGESPTPVRRELGRGRVIYSPGALEELDDATLRGCMGEPAIGVAAPEGADVTINALRTRDGSALTLHLLNHTYRSGESYTGFVSPASVARVTLPAPEGVAVGNLALRLLGFGDGSFSLHIRVNGQDLEPIDGAALRGKRWTTVPLPAELVRETNVVELRCEGELTYSNNFFALYLDPAASAPASEWSADGKQFSREDLSHLNGRQGGAYKVALVARNQSVPAVPFAVNLVPVEGVKVRAAADRAPEGASALLISPDRDPVALALERDGTDLVATVPTLDIYGVVVVSADRELLASVEARNHPPYYAAPMPRTRAWAKLA
ncbi:MAG TPA: hypothetical protein VM283_04250, partial [Armatimonadota bacterium]|nr:hypothetical protein [Armatimonadota bacterium]